MGSPRLSSPRAPGTSRTASKGYDGAFTETAVLAAMAAFLVVVLVVVVLAYIIQRLIMCRRVRTGR